MSGVFRVRFEPLDKTMQRRFPLAGDSPLHSYVVSVKLPKNVLSDNLLQLRDVLIDHLVGHNVVLERAGEVLVVGRHVDQTMT